MWIAATGMWLLTSIILGNIGQLYILYNLRFLFFVFVKQLY